MLNKFFEKIKNKDSLENNDDVIIESSQLWTKQDILDLIEDLDDEEIDDIGNIIHSAIMYNEDTDEMDDYEDEDYEDEQNESEDISEKKFFATRNRQLNMAKKHNVADRKRKARLLAKYYKKNKVRIKKQHKKYIKKAKRNPNLVKTHKQ